MEKDTLFKKWWWNNVGQIDYKEIAWENLRRWQKFSLFSLWWKLNVYLSVKSHITIHKKEENFIICNFFKAFALFSIKQSLHNRKSPVKKSIPALPLWVCESGHSESSTLIRFIYEGVTLIPSSKSLCVIYEIVHMKYCVE